MASTATSYHPTRDDFAAMLDESFAGGNLQESSVIKGIVVAIEKDMAVIDVGLKTEGRVALREFAGPGREADLKVGDEVEVFLDRIENALGEAVLSRDKARREESWGKLEKAFNNNEKVHGVIFNQVKGGFTVEIDGEAALDLIEDDAVHLFVVVERLLELAPAFLAAGLVARQHGLAERILDTVEKHLDLVADLEIGFAAGPCEFAQRHAAFGFQADVDDGHVLFNRNNNTLDDGAFLQVAAGKGLVEHGGKIVAGRMIRSSSRSHLFSRCGCRRPFGLRGVSRVKCQGSANPNDRSLRRSQERAGSMPARSIR